MKQLLKASLIIAGLAGVAWAGPVGPPGGPPVFNSGFPQHAQFNVSSGTVRDALYIRYLVPGLCHSTDAQGRLISITCGSGGGQTSLGVNWNGVPVTSPTIALNAVSPIIVTAVSGGTTAQFSLDPSSVTLAGQAIIRLRDTLQSGATLYISSGTILNLISQNLVANSAAFPNGLTANGTIVGNAQLQIFGLSTFFGPVLSANYGYQMPDGSVMTSTANFVWNSAAPQNAALNITSATIRTQLSLPFLTPSQCMTTDAAGHVTSQTCGSGGTSIAISTGGVIITSPTVQIDFNGSQFNGALTGPTSSQISLNLSSVTAQGNSIRLSTLQTNLAAVGVATGTLSGSTTTLQNQVTANTVGLVAVGVTTASLQTQVSGKGPGTITGVAVGANIIGGGTSGNIAIALSTGITVASASVTTDAVVYGTATVYQLDIGRNAGDFNGSEWDAAEGLLPPGIVGAQVVAADSTTHHLWVNPNNGGWRGEVSSSYTVVSPGDVAAWTAFGELGDIGPPPWVVVPSTFAWTLPYPVTASSQLIVTGGSTTVVGAMSHVGYSTHAVINAFEDVSQSSMAVGFIQAGGSYGTAGQVLTSGGRTSSATWTTVSGGGGGTYPTTITSSMTISSYTLVQANPNNFNSTFITSGTPTYGVYPDPAFQRAYSVGTIKACTDFLSDQDNYGTTTPWQICRWSTNDLDFGLKSQSGGMSSLLALSTNGSFPVGSTVTVNGDFIVASGQIESPTIKNSALAGVTISSGVSISPVVVTATTTLTSDMSLVLASCTTRGASPNAWITLTLPSSRGNGEWHRIYNVGADSCSIRIAGNGTDLIESTGVIRLDAQTQHAYLDSVGSGMWGGNIQYTPWSVFTTQDDVGTFTVASSSLVYSYPVYLPVPVAVMGFRFNRTTNTGWISTALTDMNGRYVVGVSTQLTVNNPNNYMTGGVTQVAPGWYRWEVTANNTLVTITASNSASGQHMFGSTVGTNAFGLDLSQFVPTLPGTGNSNTYPAIDLIVNGGLQGF